MQQQSSPKDCSYILSAFKRLFTEVLVKLHVYYYKQIRGIPQGNVLSSLFANLFLAQVEREALFARYAVDYTPYISFSQEFIDLNPHISLFNHDQPINYHNHQPAQLKVYWDLSMVRKMDDFLLIIFPTLSPSSSRQLLHFRKLYPLSLI